MPFFINKSRLSDRKLAELIIEKNEKSLEVFIKRYQSSLFSFCLGILKDAAESEDMVQESFLKFYENLDNLNPEKSIKAFLFRIARNLCLDSIKKKKPVYKDTAPEMEFRETPFESYCRSDDEKKLHLAIDNLGEAEKEAVLLKYISGMKYSEISEIMGKTESAVDSLLFRAKKKLRETLKENFN